MKKRWDFSVIKVIFSISKKHKKHENTWKIYENTLHWEIYTRHEKPSPNTRNSCKKLILDRCIWRQKIHNKQIMLVNMTTCLNRNIFQCPLSGFPNYSAAIQCTCIVFQYYFAGEALWSSIANEIIHNFVVRKNILNCTKNRRLSENIKNQVFVRSVVEIHMFARFAFLLRSVQKYGQQVNKY